MIICRSNKVIVWSLFSLVLSSSLSVISGDEQINVGTVENAHREEIIGKDLKKTCGDSYSVTCLKYDVVSWVDKINHEDNLSVMPGVTIVREENKSGRSINSNYLSNLARKFGPDSEDNSRIDDYLIAKITDYVNTHSISLNLWNNEAGTNGNARKGGGGGLGGGGGGGGGGKKGGGGLGMILAMGAMMKSTLFALSLAGIAALAGKALMTGLLALVVSGVIGLKGLTSGGHKSTTYEVISKPIYSHGETHSSSHEDHGGHYGHSSYGRSFDTLKPLPLGLQPGYIPA